MKATGKLPAVAGASVFIAGCGGGGGGGDGGGPGPTESATGILNIAITDAPVDEVSIVNVQFTGLTLKPASGDEIEIIFDAPKDFDLLTLTGGLTAELLSDTEVPAGGYNWVRLAVNAEFDNVFDSYAMKSTGEGNRVASPRRQPERPETRERLHCYRKSIDPPGYSTGIFARRCPTRSANPDFIFAPPYV